MSDEWISLVHRRESTLWVTLVCAGGRQDYFERSLGWKTGIGRYRYAGHTHQINLDAALELRGYIDAAAADDFYEDYERRCESAIAHLTKTAHAIVANIDDMQGAGSMRASFVRFFEATKGAMPFLASMVLVESALERGIRAKLARHLACGPEADAVTEAIKVCVTPYGETATVSEVRSLLEIVEWADNGSGRKAVEALSKRSPETELERELAERIARHVDRYGWQQTFTYLHEPASVEYTRARIANYLQRKAYSTAAEAALKDADRRASALAARERLALPSDVMRLLDVAGRYQTLRFRRVDCHFEAEVRIRELFRRAAQLLGVSRVDLVHLSDEEILDSLGAGQLSVDVAVLALRQSGFRVELSGEVLDIQVEAAEVTEPEEDRDYTFPLRGTTAFEGFVRGQVKIVRGPVDVSKIVGPSDILVTPMTTPDLMIGIEKSTAIVTDEGGLLCHAAIISRELGVPCVIGTECATKALRELKRVLVDAREPIGLVTLDPGPIEGGDHD